MGCLLLLPHQSLVSGEVHRASHISKMVLSTVKIGPAYLDDSVYTVWQASMRS